VHRAARVQRERIGVHDGVEILVPPHPLQWRAGAAAEARQQLPRVLRIAAEPVLARPIADPRCELHKRRLGEHQLATTNSPCGEHAVALSGDPSDDDGTSATSSRVAEHAPSATEPLPVGLGRRWMVGGRTRTCAPGQQPNCCPPMKSVGAKMGNLHWSRATGDGHLTDLTGAA